MTGEPDSKPGRRPPTIELKATEIENPAAGQDGTATARPDEPAASSQAAGPQAAGDRPQEPEPPEAAGGGAWMRSYTVRVAIGIAATVAIVGAVGTGLWLEGLGPFGETTPPAATAAGTSVPSSRAADEISARLDKIERTIQAQRPEPAIGKRLTAAEAQAKALGDSLTALNRRIDDLATASQNAAKEADAAAAAADAAKNAAANAADSIGRTGAQRGDIEALAARVAALESAVKLNADKAARQASSADDTAARLTVAAEALRAAVERGAPYRAELTAVQSLGADRDATAALEPFAASGVPSASALAHELAATTPALERALGTASGDKTFIERLEANAQKLVRITPVEAPAGTDPSTVVARIAFDAAHGDLGAALTDIAALPDTAKPLTADWVGKVQARDTAIAASRRIAADALAALSKPAAQ